MLRKSVDDAHALRASCMMPILAANCPQYAAHCFWCRCYFIM